MFRIKMKGIGKVLGQKKVKEALLEVLCLFRGCPSFFNGSTFQRTGRAAKKISAGRLIREMEYVHNIGNTQLSPNWVKEAINATREIEARAAEYGTPSLIFMASNDELIDNSVFEPYVCQNNVCTLVEMQGPHSLHLPDSVQSLGPLASQIRDF